MIKTQICDLLGIQYPVLQGGMAWVSEANLAAAVSNAGGLGIISAMNVDAEHVRAEIRKCKNLTNKNFGVNIMLMSPFAADVAKVVVEEGVAVVTTGAGSPAKYMKEWLDAGIKVIPVVASVALAMRMEDQLLDEEHDYDRTSEWFWMMIKNLGLDIYDDENYNQYDSNKIISDTVTRLNERTYRRNGTGGLFPLIGKVSKDQRKLEIWYQMMSYLDQNFILEDD